MDRRKIYQPPMVKRTVAIAEGVAVLAASVVDKVTVRTMGHELDPHGDYDFTTDPFAQPDWE